MSQQNSTTIKCTDCGKTDTVNFKPTAGKPIYCRECLAKHRTMQMDNKNPKKIERKKLFDEKQVWSRRRKG